MSRRHSQRLRGAPPTAMSNQHEQSIHGRSGQSSAQLPEKMQLEVNRGGEQSDEEHQAEDSHAAQAEPIIPEQANNSPQLEKASSSKSPHLKPSDDEIYLQNIGTQTMGYGYKSMIQVLGIQEQNGEEVIYVRLYNHIKTYTRAYLEKHHIYALIAYYEKLMGFPSPMGSKDITNPHLLLQLRKSRNQAALNKLTFQQLQDDYVPSAQNRRRFSPLRLTRRRSLTPDSRNERRNAPSNYNTKQCRFPVPHDKSN